MEDRLMECPFCHGTDDIEVHINNGGPGWEETWEGVVTCGTCGLGLLTGNYGKGGFTKEEARVRTRESWNTRAADPLLKKMAESLEAVIDPKRMKNLPTKRIYKQAEQALQEYREETCQHK